MSPSSEPTTACPDAQGSPDGNQLLISARDVHQSYRRSRRRRTATPVLRGVDLDVHAGEFLAVVGPSGQGKSTLLHCLSGLLPIDSGQLHLVGADLSRASRAERAIVRRFHTGFVFQEFNLVDSLTASQNVELALRSTGRRSHLDRILPTLELVGMADESGSYPSQLSGGQQQRVAVARVLVCEPDVVFADEPTGALDARNGQVVMSGLHELAARGSSVVVVTHDPAVAAAADRVVTLEGGVLV